MARQKIKAWLDYGKVRHSCQFQHVKALVEFDWQSRVSVNLELAHHVGATPLRAGARQCQDS